jgi:hypothetical protein
MTGKTTWAETAAKLRACGWTVEHKPHDFDEGRPYLWRSPGGLSGGDFRSSHPDGPPHAVMQEAYRLGHVDFTVLGPA